ncbi:glycosyltransferase family 4 protein [Acidipropionibacterium thoenii]|uniref:glycosyltransferase family 4 protein n=1 Tax=Acidipropionibacterium thoenii TaxID=1751 RepID=UPI000A07A69B|nr:glycosyltransferase family 4 protein [Acidipropionibacterium thoenii]
MRPVALVSCPDHSARVTPRVSRLAQALRGAGQPVVIWQVDDAAHPKADGSRPPRDHGRQQGQTPVRHLPAPRQGQTIRSRMLRRHAVAEAQQIWRRALREDRPTALNLQGFGSAGSYGLSLAKRENAPLVLTSTGETLARNRQPVPVKPFVETLRLAGAITAVSRPVRDDLHLRFGAERVQVIPDGIDPSLDLDFGWGDIPWQIDGRKVVFAAGAVDQSSGFDLLVEAAARSGVAYRLVIGGDGGSLGTLRSWSRQLGGRASIEWAGSVSARQIAAGMEHADVVVFPNRADTDPGAIVSAWKLGTPVVASATAGAVSVVNHGMDGLLTPIGQSAPLAECVDRLLIDQPLAEGLAEEGGRRVAELSWETAASRYLEVFARL